MKEPDFDHNWEERACVECHCFEKIYFQDDQVQKWPKIKNKNKQKCK